MQQPPADGWYKLLTAEEGEFYNVPVPDEGTDLVQLKSQMRVSFYDNIKLTQMTQWLLKMFIFFFYFLHNFL